MKVLIADKFADWGVEALKKAGCEVHIDPGLSDDALRDAIAQHNCSVLVVRGTKVTAAMLEASPALALVVRAGAGYNTIDVKTASQRSIFVSNCPGKNAVAVAELTFGLILALDRRIVDATIDLRGGHWKKGEYGKARGIKRRTLGIIGLGQIGQAVARRGKAFEMDVIGWSRSLTEEQADEWDITRCESVADVASRCDILTIHLAATPETKNIINADVLNRLAPGSYVINTARADVMDYDALAKVIKEKGIRAGLDVFADEPSGKEADFLPEIMRTEGLVYGTHHIGASTDQAQDAIARETIRIVDEYKHKGKVLNCVNLQAVSPAYFSLVVRHRNRPGVLAEVFKAIRGTGINVEEMENIILEGAEAACAQIKLDGELNQDVIKTIASHEHVFGATQERIRD